MPYDDDRSVPCCRSPTSASPTALCGAVGRVVLRPTGRSPGIDRPERRREDDAVRVRGARAASRRDDDHLRGMHQTAVNTASTLFYLPDAIAPWPAQTVDGPRFCVGSSVATPRVVTKSSRVSHHALLNSRMGTLSKGQRKRALLGIDRDSASSAARRRTVRRARPAEPGRRARGGCGTDACSCCRFTKRPRGARVRFARACSGGRIRGEATSRNCPHASPRRRTRHRSRRGVSCPHVDRPSSGCSPGMGVSC